MEVVSHETRKEKRIKHYSSCHKILLVGEGDFSFAACLARAFGSAANIVATSLDSRESLRVYSRAEEHLKMLEDRGCTIIHEVDVYTMSEHPLLNNKVFDIIVYNFPHATLLCREDDISQIEFHQHLVKGFFSSAVRLLACNGEVHVTHKTTHPYSSWNIKELASGVGLPFCEEELFSLYDYPGYENKKGQGIWSDRSFPVGSCSTFKFSTQRTLKF